MSRDASLTLCQEKRRHSRVERKIAVKISSCDGDILTETKNISCSGAYCRMNQRLKPMTKLGIHLLLPKIDNKKGAIQKITCEGVVVRVVPVSDSLKYFDTAIFFNHISSKDVRCLHEFIESAMEKKNNGPCH